MHRMLSGSQGRSGGLRKISPPKGFEPRTFQPYAIPAPAFKAEHLKPLKSVINEISG